MPRQLPRLSVLLQPSQAQSQSQSSSPSQGASPSVYTQHASRRTGEDLGRDDETEDEQERQPSVPHQQVDPSVESNFRRSPRLNRGLLPQPVVFRQPLDHVQEVREKSLLSRRHDSIDHGKDPHGKTESNTPSTSHSTTSPSNSPSLGINSVKTQIQPIYPRERKSRYLSEGDRRTILSRIEKGEKQSVLAKEYRVSRAAICNLYKNRQEVLFRVDRNPEAKHPKRARIAKLKTLIKVEQHAPQESVASGNSTIAPTATSVGRLVAATADTTASSSSTSISPIGGEVAYSNPFVRRPDHQTPSTRELQYAEEHQRMEQRQRMEEQQMEQPHHTEMHTHTRRNGYMFDSENRELHVHQVGMKCDSIKILQAVLRDESTQVDEYRLATDRILRLLFEDAIHFLPKRRKEFRTALGDECEGVTFYRKDRVCAVSMERCGNVMLQALSQVEPMIPTGHVSLACYQSSVAGGNLTPPSMENRNQVHFHLPPTLTNSCKLYLLDTVCSTGSEACIVIHALINQLQFREGNIFFVTLVSAYPALRRIHQLFPEVILITGWMDGKVDQLNRIRPGIGNFYKRYWNLSTSPNGASS